MDRLQTDFVLAVHNMGPLITLVQTQQLSIVVTMCLKLLGGYLHNGLLHLRLTERRKRGFQIVHDALEAVALHYLRLMAAQQAEGHLKDHRRPLNEYKI